MGDHRDLGDSGPGDAVSAEPPEGLRHVAEQLFGDRLSLAVRYAELLITDGLDRGLIGPREAPRIWRRHVLNCAVVRDLVPIGAYVIDVGSGAGLPGLVLAIARSDLRVVLLEPTMRRAAFLSEAIDKLTLPEVSVVRARAEEQASGRGILTPGEADIVTARAVAPLRRLAAWSLPLLTGGGRLLALKGASAVDEVAEYEAEVIRQGGSVPVVRECGAGVLDPPTTVIEIVRSVAGAARSPRPRASRRATDRTSRARPHR